MMRTLLWIARLGAVAAIVPLLLILTGERGAGPNGAREWIYLALFPLGFSAGYFIAWRYPLIGGSISLICLATSLIVIGKTFPLAAYLIWGVLGLPGLLFVMAGLLNQNRTDAPPCLTRRCN